MNLTNSTTEVSPSSDKDEIGEDKIINVSERVMQLKELSTTLEDDFEMGGSLKVGMFEFNSGHIGKPLFVIYLGPETYRKRDVNKDAISFSYKGSIYLHGSKILYEECVTKLNLVEGQPIAITYLGEKETRGSGNKYKAFNVNLLKKKKV